LFVKTALIALAGMATGGAGLVAIAGVTAAIDAAIKGEKLSSILAKGAGAALLGLGAQEVQAMLTGGEDFVAPNTNVTPGVDDVVTPTPVAPTELATYTVQSGDTLSQIAQKYGISVQELIGLNPQLAADAGATGGQSLNPDVLFPGQQITLPPASGADVYAGGVGTNANTMADIARGEVPDSSITQGMANKGQAAASSTSDVSQAAIDYSKSGPVSVDSLGQKLEYGVPVNNQGSFIPPNSSLPADELAKQTAAYNSWKADFTKRFPDATLGADGVMQGIKPGLAPMFPKAVQESVKLIRLPANQLIDQKLTVMAWALTESVGQVPSHNMHLTRRGVLTVIENVDRHRRALLKELAAAGPDRTNIPAVPREDMPLAPQDGVVKPGMIGKGLNYLDKLTGKVGGYLSKQAQNFTRKVTAAKLKTEWEQEGHQTDSDYIAAFLTKQGVPQGVVTDVYGKMGIPYTAPAAPAAAPVGGAQRQAYVGGINPATNKPWTGDELRAEYYPADPEATDDEVAADTAAAPNPFGQMTNQLQNYGTSSTGSQVTRTATGLKNTASPNNPNAVAAAKTAPASTTTAATTTAAAKPAAGTFPGEDPQGAGYVGRLEVKRRQAARDAQAAKKPAAANFGQQATGYKSVNYAPNIKTGVSLPKSAGSTAAQTKTPTQAEKDAYVKAIGAPAMVETRIATALKKSVAEMLQMVETKEDVQKIKQFVDQTFVRYGAVNESAFVVRNQILEHVTQVGAQRRRDFAAQHTH
jgi:LysM repeat protein